MSPSQEENASVPTVVVDRELEHRVRRLERHRSCVEEIFFKAAAVGAILLIVALVLFFYLTPNDLVRDLNEVDKLHEQMRDVQKFLVQEMVHPCASGDSRCLIKRLELLRGFELYLTPVSETSELHDIQGLTN